MKRLKFVWILLPALMALWSGPAYAEEKKQTYYELPDVVVTATKTERTIDEVPTNVTVVTKEEIERIQPTNLADLLRFVPGLVINSGGSDTSVYSSGFRGIQPSARGILILRDGVEMNNPTNVADFIKFPIADIERIEVVKSPASALYGVAGVGGVINFITKKPVETVEGDLSVTYGSFNRVDTDGYVAGRLENGFNYKLSGWFFDTDGYRDQSDTKNLAVSPSLGWKNDRIDFQISSNFRKVDNEGVPGGLPLDTWEDDPEKATNKGDSGESTTTNSGARLNWTVAERTLAAFKVSYKTNDWDIEDYGYHYEGSGIYEWTAETNLQQGFNIGPVENTLLAGIEYRDLNNEVEMRPDDYSLEHGTDYFLTKVEVSEEIWGFFAQDEIRPFEKLVLTAGVRYDMISTDYKHSASSNNFDNDHEKWSPRVGFTYALMPSLNFFGNYSQGIRSVQLSRPPFALKGNLDPEKLESFEAGIRGQLFGFLDYNIAGFHVITDDIIIRTNQRYVYENAGEAESTGVEAQVKMNLPKGFYVGFDYSYIDSEFTDYVTASSDYTDKKVPLVPDHMFGVNLGWAHPIYGRIDTSVRYVNERYIDNANTYELDAYTVANAKYTYTFRSLDFSVAVTNLFDEAYADYAETDGGTYVPGPAVWPADGRAFCGSIRYRF